MSFLNTHWVRGLRGIHRSMRHQKCLFTQSGLNKKINICIEGNIGCGKTTSLKHFKALGGLVEINEEPVKQWRDFCDANPLTLMRQLQQELSHLGLHYLQALLYEDPQRWSFLFQSFATLTLFQRHFQEQVKPIRLMERSVYSARYFFTENLYQNGKLTDLEYQILIKWFDWEMEQHPVNIDLLIYLQTSPETCLERIQARQRPEEKIVSLDYLRDLHELHERFLVKRDHHVKLKSKVLVINNNHDKRTMEKTFHEVILDSLLKLGITPSPNPVTDSAHRPPS